MVDHLGAGGAVEVPGGLVRQQEARLVDEGPGNGHPLLLAPGQLPGVMPQPVAEADRRQLLPSPVEGIGLARQLARRGHVLERGHGGDEVEGLEHDAHVPAPEPRERVLVEGAEIVAGHGGPPGGGPLQAADDHEERGLARPGRPDDAHRFSGGEIEVDAAQDLHRAGRAGQCDAETPERYDGTGGGGNRHGG